ncbi:MAG TPA: sigma factor-like helix-turn-helix DNA-binding protein [Terriglobales bacterium]|jgi:DNA-directed RNA polymerase specialized sigma24 family protein
MNVHISYRVHKTPDIEKDIHHQVEKLRRRLQVFRPELVHLKGSVEQTSPREGFLVSLNLRLPSGQMAVQNSATTAVPAIKAAFDDLLQQITKHKDLLRSSHKWQRRQQTRPRSRPEIPFEETLAAVPMPTISADDIRTYVNANLGRLERFVEREIYFRETADQVQPDTISKEEVIDEAIARALGDGQDKPERLALEPWLYRLAIRALEDLAEHPPEADDSVHLEDSARNPNVRASDEPHLQYHQPDESLTEENVIPDRRVATPEDIASTDEMVSMVEIALRGAEHADREAFILHALEGFSIEEVAAITDRPPEQVLSSITAAREQLRKSPPLANRFRETLLQKTSAV